jgi:hypothetical protein
VGRKLRSRGRRVGEAVRLPESEESAGGLCLLKDVFLDRVCLVCDWAIVMLLAEQKNSHRAVLHLW